MKWSRFLIINCVVWFCMSEGCTLKEIRSKTKVGVEYRRKNSDKSDAERYLAQEAVQFKWDNGVDTSVIYRRRDVSDSPSGDHDDGVWFEIGVPIWKAPKKPDAMAARVAQLEKRIAQLERSQSQALDAHVEPIHN